jgi:hypothetical protein
LNPDSATVVGDEKTKGKFMSILNTVSNKLYDIRQAHNSKVSNDARYIVTWAIILIFVVFLAGVLFLVMQ